MLLPYENKDIHTPYRYVEDHQLLEELGDAAQVVLLVPGLAENGVTVVSGFAYGIDKMAHLGALEVGGDTIAVMAGGLDRCYPKVHENLFNRIKNEGLVLSEYPDNTEYMPFHFPQRNRIISGISSAVVVVEAGQSSDSYSDRKSVV